MMTFLLFAIMFKDIQFKRLLTKAPHSWSIGSREDISILSWTLGWAKKTKILIWAFLFAGQLQNGVRNPQKKFQIYRPINDRWQAIFVLGSVLMGKRPKNGQKMTIFKNGLKTHPKVVNASNQR